MFCQPAFASINERLNLDLPEQSLTRSIIALGKAGKISIVVPSYLLNGLQAPALKEELNVRSALLHLLKDTNLTYKEINNSVIAIVPIKEKQHNKKPLAQSLEEIFIIGQQVTGSYLNRTDLQGSAPIDIITQYELNISGAQSIAEFLKFIPSVSGNSTSTAISNGGDGTATVTLRGLPASNTLVLINGRRVATEVLSGDSVDLNTIPSAAVERIEVFKDGASAIYGTDAIAGVINIIMKREYDGLLMEQYLGSTYKNDTETKYSHLLWGKTYDKASFLISAQLFEQNGLYSRDRAVSRSADGRPQGGLDKRSSATPYTNITLATGEMLILQEGENGDSPKDFRTRTPEDRFDFQSQNSSISPSARKNLYLSSVLTLNDTTTFSIDGSFNESDATISLASTPLLIATLNTPITIAADNIYNPFDSEITDARRRVVELEPRLRHNVSRAKRFNAVLSGAPDKASWELATYWSRVDSTQNIENLLSESRVRRALGPAADCLGIDIDGCQPLNLFGAPGAISDTQLAYIKARDRSDGFSELGGLSGHFSSTLLDLPAGPLLALAGFDIRREEINSTLITEDNGIPSIGGALQASSVGSRNSGEVFFESHIPILRQAPYAYSLELELAARHSRYSRFRHNTSPKFGLRYRPVKDTLIRSTYSEGFRTPSLGELYSGKSQSQLALTDPCSLDENINYLGCPTVTDESITQILTIFEGQSELAAETSKSHTIGLVWTPELRGDFYLSIDLFDIEQKNVVDLDAQLVLNRNAKFNEFTEFVTRNENGTVVNVIAPYFNIGQKRIRGIDTSIKYTLHSQKLGRFTYSFNASYLDNHQVKLSEEFPFESIAGTFRDEARNGDGALPRWKANTGLYWTSEHFEINYSINYIHHLRDVTNENVTPRRMESWTTHDTQFSFRTGRQPHIKFVIGIDNIWNRSPPFSVSAFNDNYDARTYDIKGQFVYGKVLLEF